jgi:geranylgeranyl pyrophosphate synthase
MTVPDLSSYLDGLRHEVDAALDRVLGSLAAPALIVEAMRYPLNGSGKRLRPCLTLSVADSVRARPEVARSSAHARALARPAACAVEMIHTYSLVHDDLPAMDDDDLRRGRPTSHVVYGDGLAILAGDGLLTEAFGVLACAPSAAAEAGDPIVDAERRARAVSVLAAAAGAAGMVGGQAMDLAAAGQVRGRHTAFDPATLEDMHRRKTGALIRAACTLGAIVCGANDEAIHAIDAYAQDLGLAFQIVDDVLDVEGSNDALGKTAGKDAAAGKPTYPALFGVEGARALAAECVVRAKDALASAGLDGRLGEIAEWSLARKR